ncbi:hypothetical protein MMC24_006596, partial [Lignoscripta atroalba]|nr:hypothetical protein [Lignoscripta atroalba]
MRILLTRLSIFVSSHVGASAKRLSRDGGNSSSSGMLHNSNNNTNNWTRKLLGANHQQQQSNSTGEGQGQKSSGRLNDRGGECTRGDDVRRSVAPRLGEVEMVVPMGRIHVTRQVELTESWE